MMSVNKKKNVATQVDLQIIDLFCISTQDCQSEERDNPIHRNFRSNIKQIHKPVIKTLLHNHKQP